MKVLLTTLNAKYIHKNLAIRLLYCASPIKESTQICEFVIKDDPYRICESILSYECDVVVFSTYIWNRIPTMSVIHLLKEKNPHVHIIMGGPEVSFDSFSLCDQGVDALSLGEGEISLWNYIEMLSKKGTYEVKGIYTLEYPNKEYQKIDLRFNEQNESPYFLAMDDKDMGNRYLYLETSRGCPYGCSYCLSSTDRKVRLYSTDYIMNTLKQISTSSVKQVKLLDRTFNVDPTRALKMVRYINEHCVNQIFQFEIVAETLSEELLTFIEKEADVNRFRFEIGVQSFYPKTLSAVNRIQNNQRLKEVIERLHKAKAIMHVDLIAGLPYENYLQFKDSFNKLFDLHASELQLGVLKLLKGTKLRKEASLYEFIYEDLPPYTISSTAWLSEVELDRIKASAQAVEKYYNSGKCRYVIDQLIQDKVITPFSLFESLGEQLEAMKRPYQLHQLYESFLKIDLKVKREYLDSYLMRNYYAIFKQKPKKIIDPLDLTIRKKVMKFMEENSEEDALTLYHYGMVERCYLDELGYQVVIYNSQHRLPKRYFVNLDINYYKEMPNE
ncbi:MAG: DUF4080 domain-containing protein [Erysipelotrichaceae bacterium]